MEVSIDFSCERQFGFHFIRHFVRYKFRIFALLLCHQVSGLSDSYYYRLMHYSGVCPGYSPFREALWWGYNSEFTIILFTAVYTE